MCNDYRTITTCQSLSFYSLAGTLGSGTKHVEIRRTLQPDNYMSGLALFGDQLVFLAYFLDQEDCEVESIAKAFPWQLLVLQKLFSYGWWICKFSIPEYCFRDMHISQKRG
ncbi:uncharacterized protein [Physcomitrium patens]|uniref:uncharacterized protein n=1 Tax=Physcomitrium patens TaxID=3218 RepID=UPI000D15C912|nr:uncharacterized protein LOC112286527 [Physcomitrium patens]|eukprot:XP_024384243.1 uncharacterized protein LOC112286527 [Physcomitrella patens]